MTKRVFFSEEKKESAMRLAEENGNVEEEKNGD